MIISKRNLKKYNKKCWKPSKLFESVLDHKNNIGWKEKQIRLITFHMIDLLILDSA